MNATQSGTCRALSVRALTSCKVANRRSRNFGMVDSMDGCEGNSKITTETAPPPLGSSGDFRPEPAEVSKRKPNNLSFTEVPSSQDADYYDEDAVRALATVSACKSCRPEARANSQHETSGRAPRGAGWRRAWAVCVGQTQCGSRETDVAASH